MNLLLPHFPIHLSSITLFGITLLLGLIGGELARKSYILPVISGYIIIGFLVGPNGFAIVNTPILATARIFIEISLSLISFELGRHLDFRWLCRDPGLLPMAAAESGLTFVAISLAMHFFAGMPWLQSIIAGTIAIATSPAVIMMVSNDLSAEGPVTRRTFFLTSVNNLIALVLFTFLLPMTHHATSLKVPIYQLTVSFVFGMFMFFVAQLLASLTGKNRENQFVLFIGLVTVTTGISDAFHLSPMLSLFTLGVAARNLDYKHRLMEIDFGWLARVFFVLLFVVTGIHLQFGGLWSATSAILIFILMRGLAKTVGISLFAKLSNLTKNQVFSLSFALSPMAGLAIGMSNMLIDFNPDFEKQFLLIIIGAIATLNIIGPIATQIAFIKAGETSSHYDKPSTIQ